MRLSCGMFEDNFLLKSLTVDDGVFDFRAASRFEIDDFLVMTALTLYRYINHDQFFHLKFAYDQ